MAERSRHRNPNWRGGRSVASNGYVLIRVGVDHHLADVRGYAYEHRLVAEEKLGRCLLPGEIPHHINEIKTDNRPENIEIVPSVAHHRFHHRKTGRRRRLPDEQNQEITCACGCETRFLRFDEAGRPRTYVSGHNPIASPTQDAVLKAIVDVQRPASLADLGARLPFPRQSIKTALSILHAKGLVRRVSHGVWGATQ